MKTFCPNCNETVLFDNFDYYFSLIANYFTTHTTERSCSKCDIRVCIYSDYIYYFRFEEFNIDQTKLVTSDIININGSIYIRILNSPKNVYFHDLAIDNFKLSNIKFIFNKLNTFKNNQVFL